MPRYAVKLGDVMLRSEKPITLEERKRAQERLAQLVLLSPPDAMITEDGLQITFVVD